jgi:hypothetical protein
MLPASRKLIADLQLDAYVAHFSSIELSWVPLLLHKLNIPLIYNEHSNVNIIQTERWNKTEHLACARVCDRIVLLLEEYRNAYPDFLQERISIIPNAVPKARRIARPEDP